MIAALLLAVVLAQDAPAVAERQLRDVEAGVTDGASGGVYLDVGSDAGVAVGIRGALVRDGVKVAELEVRHVSATSCYVLVIAVDPQFQVQPGDRALLRAVPPPAAARGGGEKEPGPARPFTPLLAPPQPQAESQAGPIFHGSASFTSSWLHDAESGRDYIYSRFFTRGAIERLGGGPWSLAWGLDLSTRSGDGYDDDSQQGEWRLRADEFVLRRHFEDGSVLGAGRVQALALPGLGRIDGIYGEKVMADGFRLGAIAGLRPDPDDLGYNTRAPIAAAWGAYDRAWDGGGRLTASAGLMSTWFEGAADQQALLADLYLRTSGGHWLRATSQFDWYSGDEPSRSGVAVTRVNGAGNLHLSRIFDLRGYWSQYQLPDTDYERRDAPDDRLYGRGNRRVALALAETFESGLGLEEEVAQVSGDGTEADWQYTLRARQSPLFGAESLGADGAVFNLVGLDTDGFGTSLGLQWIPSGSLYFRLGYDATSTEVGDSGDFLSHTVSLWTNYDLGERTSLWLRLARSFGDELDSWGGDLGLTWRF